MKTAAAVLALFLSADALTLKSKTGNKLASQMKHKSLAQIKAKWDDDQDDDDQDGDDQDEDDQDDDDQDGDDQDEDDQDDDDQDDAGQDDDDQD
jgi:hypothetical protein